jgi:hypothetical protein
LKLGPVIQEERYATGRVSDLVCFSARDYEINRSVTLNCTGISRGGKGSKSHIGFLFVTVEGAKKERKEKRPTY